MTMLSCSLGRLVELANGPARLLGSMYLTQRPINEIMVEAELISSGLSQPPFKASKHSGCDAQDTDEIDM